MKTSIFAVIIAVSSFSAIPAFANEINNDNEYTINGRSVDLIEVVLRDSGVAVSSVEEWGGYVRAWVPNANGGSDMQFFDADTLQPVQFVRK